MTQTKFPPGWDDERVARVLAHYDRQTEEEAVAEDEAFDNLTEAPVIDDRRPASARPFEVTPQPMGIRSDLNLDSIEQLLDRLESPARR